ncbi:MAG TPA: hypothetical protein VID48_10960 [Solirubrobacteraceae bacterium]
MAAAASAIAGAQLEYARQRLRGLDADPSFRAMPVGASAATHNRETHACI